MFNPRLARLANTIRPSFIHIAFKPLQGVLVTVVSTPVFFWLLYKNLGPEAMGEQINLFVISLAAFGCGYFFYLLVCLVKSVFQARSEDEKIGKWYASEYVYNEPYLLGTVRVSPENNDIPVLITVEDAPKNAFVSYKVEVEDAKDRVFAFVDTYPPSAKHIFMNIKGGAEWGRPNANSPITGAIRIDSNKALSLTTVLLPNTMPVIVRVYMKSWEPYEYAQSPKEIH